MPDIPAITFSEANDPSAGAQRELELGRQVREDAGMLSLIEPNGTAAFTFLDSITAEFGLEVLAEINAAIETGVMPSARAPLARQLASIGGTPLDGQPAARDIETSLFSDTAFTASALLTVAAGMVQRAAESSSGSLPKHESFDKTSDGLRHQTDLFTNWTVTTGGGKVSVEISMKATDRITDAAGGSFIALYTSTTTGSFEVNACPDKDGVGEGTYSFETKHELNDVSGAASARSTGGRSAKAPFRVFNGDDAHLVRIEAELDIKADASGPSTPGGSWNVGAPVNVVIPAGGISSSTIGEVAFTGTGGQAAGQAAGGAISFTTSMAQLFLIQVGKEAEKFWRSGQCIDLVPSRDSGQVSPNERIKLTVEAKEAFGAKATIEKPIEAAFSGKQSLDPAGRPIHPAEFDFVAGSQKDERGTIELKQTSDRGIGTRKVVYTVGGGDLLLSLEGVTSWSAPGAKFEAGVRLTDLRLTPDAQGTYHGSGTLTLLKRQVLSGECTVEVDTPVSIDVQVRLQEGEPERGAITISMPSGTVTQRCPAAQLNVPVPMAAVLGPWTMFVTTRGPYPLGEPTDVAGGMDGTSLSATINLRRAE